MLDHAGHDMHLDAAKAADSLQRATEAGDVGRGFAVRGLAPALGAADHATGNHGQPWLGVEPIATGVVECQFETVIAKLAVDQARGFWQVHDAAGQGAHIQHLALRGEFVSTKGGGSPVERDQLRLHRFTCSVFGSE